MPEHRLHGVTGKYRRQELQLFPLSQACRGPVQLDGGRRIGGYGQYRSEKLPRICTFVRIQRRCGHVERGVLEDLIWITIIPESGFEDTLSGCRYVLRQACHGGDVLAVGKGTLTNIRHILTNYHLAKSTIPAKRSGWKNRGGNSSPLAIRNVTANVDFRDFTGYIGAHVRHATRDRDGGESAALKGIGADVCHAGRNHDGGEVCAARKGSLGDAGDAVSGAVVGNGRGNRDAAGIFVVTGSHADAVAAGKDVIVDAPHLEVIRRGECRHGQ